MEISLSAYAWLESILAQPLSRKKDSVVLSLADSDNLKNGLIFSTLLTKKFLFRQKSLKEELKQLRPGRNPGVRLQNWNILVPVLAKIGVHVTPETKLLIVNENVPAILSLLEQLKRHRLQDPPEQLAEQSSQNSLSEGTGCLKYLVSSLIASFQVSARQALGMLANQAERMRDLLVIGIHQDFTQVESWLVSMSGRSPELAEAILSDPESLPHVFNVFRGGLDSQSEKVQSLTIYVYVQLGRQLSSLSHQMAGWFIQSEAYSTVVRSILNQHLPYAFIELLVTLSGFQLTNLLITRVPEAFDDKTAIDLAFTLLNTVSHLDLSELVGWALSKKPTLRTAEFVCALWSKHCDDFQCSEYTQTQALTHIEFASQSMSEFEKVLIGGHLFDIYAQARNPLILEWILECVSDQPKNKHLREFILSNLSLLVLQGVLVPGLLDRVLLLFQGLDYSKLNLGELELIQALCRASVLQPTQGALLLDSALNGFYEAPLQTTRHGLFLILNKFCSHRLAEKICVETLGSKLSESIHETSDYSGLRITQMIISDLVKLNCKSILRKLLNTALDLKHKVGKGNAEFEAILTQLSLELGQSLPSLTVSTRTAHKHPYLAFIEKNRLKRNQEAAEAVRQEAERNKAERRRRNIKNVRSLQRVALGLDPQFREVKEKVLCKVPALNEFALANIEEEPEFEQGLIYHVLKRYSRVTAALFNDYSRSSAPPRLSVNEVCKLLRDNKVPTQLISTDTVKMIYAAIATQQKVRTLCYEDFLNFLYQVAVKIFSVSPRDLRQYPSAIALKALFESFARAGVYPLQYFTFVPVGDPEVLAILDRRLRGNKHSVLPPGYKSVKERVLTVRYVVDGPSSKALVLELLDDLLNRVFRVHILEPLIEVHTVRRATEAATPIILTKSTKHMPHLLPGIRHALSSLYPDYHHDMLLECAKTMDDLIYSTDLHSSTLQTRNPGAPVINQATQLKLHEEEQAVWSNEASEQRRKQRARKLTEILRSRRGLLNRQRSVTRQRGLSERLEKQRNLHSYSEKTVRKKLVVESSQDRQVRILGEQFKKALEAVVAAYSSNAGALTLSQCRALVRDRKVVPELLSALDFNYIAAGCVSRDRITPIHLHKLLAKVAEFSRRMLTAGLPATQRSLGDAYLALLQVMGLTKDS